MDLPPVWLTAKEAAERARVTADTIYREVKAGRLRAARIGGRRELRFRESYIDAWLEQSEPQEDVRLLNGPYPFPRGIKVVG